MKSASLLLSIVVSAIGSTNAAEFKFLKVGSNPESVCRGFDEKLYITMINGEDPGMVGSMWSMAIPSQNSVEE